MLVCVVYFYISIANIICLALYFRSLIKDWLALDCLTGLYFL